MTDVAPGASGQSGGSPEPGGTSSGGSPEPGGTSSGADRTYTQEQVNALRAEDRRRTESRFPDYDQVKQELADIKAAGQSELERAQTQAKDADTRAADATRQRDSLLVRSAVVASAARAGALDPDVVVALLADTLKVNADGAIDGDVDAAVNKLLEDKPYLKNGSGPARIGSADQGTHTRPPARTETPNSRMDDLLRQQPGR